MPHVDWRPRLSLALPPEAAKGLCERSSHDSKTRIFRTPVELIYTARPGAQITLTVTIGR